MFEKSLLIIMPIKKCLEEFDRIVQVSMSYACLMAQDELRQALTFDDVLLMPAESAVLPAEVDISTI